MEDNKEKTYEFACGMKARLKPPTWGTDKKVLALLSGVELGKFSDLWSIQVKDVVSLVSANDVIEKMFDIILDIEGDRSYNNLKTEEVVRVVEDFFLMRVSLKGLLSNGKSKAGSR